MASIFWEAPEPLWSVAIAQNKKEDKLLGGIFYHQDKTPAYKKKLAPSAIHELRFELLQTIASYC